MEVSNNVESIEEAIDFVRKQTQPDTVSNVLVADILTQIFNNTKNKTMKSRVILTAQNPQAVIVKNNDATKAIGIMSVWVANKSAKTKSLELQYVGDAAKFTTITNFPIGSKVGSIFTNTFPITNGKDLMIKMINGDGSAIDETDELIVVLEYEMY